MRQQSTIALGVFDLEHLDLSSPPLAHSSAAGSQCDRALAQLHHALVLELVRDVLAELARIRRFEGASEDYACL